MPVKLPDLLRGRARVRPDQTAATTNHRTQVLAVTILGADLLRVGRAA